MTAEQLIKIYNSDGNVTSEIEPPEFLLSYWNPELAHQVYKVIAANQRQSSAHTKDRSEVSGGGKKPWRQKGTGRARQGSIRSPLWRHGGVSFGPRNTKDFFQKINRNMSRRALVSVLAHLFRAGRLKVLDQFALELSKTKELARIIKNLSGDHSVLLVTADREGRINRFVRNLSRAEFLTIPNLNVYDLLNHHYLILDSKALELLNQKFSHAK